MQHHATNIDPEQPITITAPARIWSDLFVLSNYEPNYREAHKVLHDALVEAAGGDEVWNVEGSLQRIAHDSGDGFTIFHCPFCGSGMVIARGDGSAECAHCSQVFTVQVQPFLPGLPQTDPNVPLFGGDHPAPGEEPTPPADEAEDASNGAGEAENKAQANRRYVTTTGIALDHDAYLFRLALEHADDPRVVVAARRRSVSLGTVTAISDRSSGWSDAIKNPLVNQVRKRPGWTVHDEDRASFGHGGIRAHIWHRPAYPEYGSPADYDVSITHSDQPVTINRTGNSFLSPKSAMDAVERYTGKYYPDWKDQAEPPQEQHYVEEDTSHYWHTRPITG